MDEREEGCGRPPGDQNDLLLEQYGGTADQVLPDAAAQRELFDRLVPEKIDSGRNPKTFESMLSRVAGVSKKAAVRALIHLLDQAREVQLSILERGEPEPKEETLFSRQTFRGALPEISKVRLENTRFAEYPSVRDRIVAFEGEKTNQNLHSLGEIWHLSEEKPRDVAESLVEIGFFERRGDKASPVYWVPILYRPALNMVQGSAEPGMPHDPDES